MDDKVYQIRPFSHSDQEDAKSVILEGLGNHFGYIDETLNPDLDDIWQHYIVKGDIFVVAECEGELVGTGGLIREIGGNGRLVRMSVRQLHQRKGIGQSIVCHLIEKAQEQGYRHLLVETNFDWNDAIGLYLSCGFQEYDRDEESIHLRLRFKFRP